MDDSIRKMLEGIENIDEEFISATCESCRKLKPIPFTVTGKDEAPKLKFCSVLCIRNRMNVMKSSDWAKLTNPKENSDTPNHSGSKKKKKSNQV